MTAPLRCSFCMRSDAEVRKLVAGAGGGYICDSCASIAVRIMADPACSMLARARSWLGKRLCVRRDDLRLRASAPAA